ncbi:MAG TPA: M42 family metallopeptidase [Bacillota bacterium]|nr:M42 family metallopeptidase [Bacillota bacterium]HOJ83834.1 M42 family metallopeptidase [Bacillota bacterium]HOL14861.1 M42 family metallopeptidase [Bacillota bacterium]HPZ11736.1 M42 family metallopeptidase [Bacillota bacterium]
METLIKELVEAYGPSGEEAAVRELIEEKIKDSVDRTFTDNLGNLFAIREGAAPLLMFSAHMDEIGVIVTHIDDNGFLRIAPIGGVAPHLLVGQRLSFKNGVTGTVYHEKIKALKELDWPKLYLDIGAAGAAAAREHIRIGDMACLHQPFVNLGGRYMAKAMDDRIGCAVLVEAARRLPGSLPQGVCFVFSVQEEVGLRGATTAAYRLEPDYGFAVDVTLVGDTPEAPLMAVSLGQGPAIKVKDRSVLCHPRVRELMIETAEKHKIPYQLEVLERGGTDAGAIHLSREGVPSGAISIPCRYVHSPSEMVDAGDVAHAVELIEKIIMVSWPLPDSGSGA